VIGLMEKYQPMGRTGIFDLTIKKGNGHMVSYDGLKMSAGNTLGFSLNHYFNRIKSGIYDGEDISCDIDVVDFQSIEIVDDFHFKITCNRVSGWGKGFNTKYIDVTIQQ